MLQNNNHHSFYDGSLPINLSNVGTLPDNLSIDFENCRNRDIFRDRHTPGTYLVAEWNLMGFYSAKNPCNTSFKQQVISLLYHDVYILAETHCLNEEKIALDGYIVFQNNRVPVSKVVKGSGGIAVAIHRSVLDSHTILSVVEGIVGQIAIKMKCNSTINLIGFLGLYLSPESYKYGQEAEDFFPSGNSAVAGPLGL